MFFIRTISMVIARKGIPVHLFDDIHRVGITWQTDKMLTIIKVTSITMIWSSLETESTKYK